jgi:hypothetical protein
MVKVVETFTWFFEVNNMNMKVYIRLINDIFDEIEIAYCIERCEFMYVSSEHAQELQDMLLNFASLITASGNLVKEEHSERIIYADE